MFRRRVLPFIVFVFVSTLAIAEHRAIPTLVVESDDGNVALDLVALKIDVTIRGHLARTEYELTYRNSLDRVTGGDFHFPLPPDAEVSDLGLYFDGKLRHGVAVERTLARTAYEETVHRAVDPALVEWTAGRGFRLRVYPIPEQSNAWDIREIFEQTEEALARWERASLLARERGADIRTDERNDLTIELMWDTDWCWVDIHIVEPGGEIVKWNHTSSAAGAKFTGGYIFGYGPEIYSIPKAARGEYRVDLDYYASDETNVSLETLAHVVVYTRGQRRDYFAVLSTDQEHYTLATIPMK